MNLFIAALSLNFASEYTFLYAHNMSASVHSTHNQHQTPTAGINRACSVSLSACIKLNTGHLERGPLGEHPVG